MIHPDIEVEDVPRFLWEHIIVDLDILQNILNKNMDEIILMMHIVVDNIQTNGFSGKVLRILSNCLFLNCIDQC